jgi:hypothetical protein
MSQNRHPALQVETAQRNTRSGFHGKIKQSLVLNYFFALFSAPDGGRQTHFRLDFGTKAANLKKVWLPQAI